MSHNRHLGFRGGWVGCCFSSHCKRKNRFSLFPCPLMILKPHTREVLESIFNCYRKQGRGGVLPCISYNIVCLLIPLSLHTSLPPPTILLRLRAVSLSTQPKKKHASERENRLLRGNVTRVYYTSGSSRVCHSSTQQTMFAFARVFFPLDYP